MKKKLNNTTDPLHDAKLPVSGCLLTIKAVISQPIAMGVQKYAEDFDCSLISFAGCGEDWIEVTVRGTEENLKALNEKAKSYKPTVVRSKDCR